jgi:hypothetical protein
MSEREALERLEARVAELELRHTWSEDALARVEAALLEESRRALALEREVALLRELLRKGAPPHQGGALD